MLVEVPEDEARRPPRRRWPWVVSILVGLAMGLCAAWLVALWSWFDAGGTLGGYGAAAGSDLDQAAYDANWAHRAWIAVVAAGAVPLLYAGWWAQRAESSADRRRALAWCGAIVAGVVVLGATPAIVHAVG